ncbi:MAG: YgaP family membrane protein [Halothiobacillus sp.]
MKTNVGSIDKILRIIVGLVLIALAIFNVGGIGYWGYIGIVPLLTGLFNFCPAYTLLGLNTKGKSS